MRVIPRTDLLVAIDDSSSDNTGGTARSAGVVVVRHSMNRGKALTMETGMRVVAVRDSEEDPTRLILFSDADLDDSAAETYPLVKTVMSNGVDCVIANLPKQTGAGSHGFVICLARSAIRWAIG